VLPPGSHRTDSSFLPKGQNLPVEDIPSDINEVYKVSAFLTLEETAWTYIKTKIEADGASGGRTFRILLHVGCIKGGLPFIGYNMELVSPKRPFHKSIRTKPSFAGPEFILLSKFTYPPVITDTWIVPVEERRLKAVWEAKSQPSPVRHHYRTAAAGSPVLYAVSRYFFVSEIIPRLRRQPLPALSGAARAQKLVCGRPVVKPQGNRYLQR